jgi:hypothetical protein
VPSLLHAIATNAPYHTSQYSNIAATCFGVLHAITRERRTNIQNIAQQQILFYCVITVANIDYMIYIIVTSVIKMQY